MRRVDSDTELLYLGRRHADETERSEEQLSSPQEVAHAKTSTHHTDWQLGGEVDARRSRQCSHNSFNGAHTRQRQRIAGGAGPQSSTDGATTVEEEG